MDARLQAIVVKVKRDMKAVKRQVRKNPPRDSSYLDTHGLDAHACMVVGYQRNDEQLVGKTEDVLTELAGTLKDMGLENSFSEGDLVEAAIALGAEPRDIPQFMENLAAWL